MVTHVIFSCSVYTPVEFQDPYLEGTAAAEFCSLGFSVGYWSLFSYVLLSICKVTTLIASKYAQKILPLYSSIQSTSYHFYASPATFLLFTSVCYAFSRHLISPWLRWTQKLFLRIYISFFLWSNCFMSKPKVIYFQQIRLLKWILNKHL